MGRFSVECHLANYAEVVEARSGSRAPDQVHRLTIQGVVDTGATRLVLPGSAVSALGLPKAGKTSVKYADGRRAVRSMVDDVRLEIQGRSATFRAVVEPKRTTALIGAIVLEELDLLPDCTKQVILPRDPHGLVTEIE
jgi:predicted aspartyl protease